MEADASSIGMCDETAVFRPLCIKRGRPNVVETSQKIAKSHTDSWRDVRSGEEAAQRTVSPAQLTTVLIDMKCTLHSFPELSQARDVERN